MFTIDAIISNPSGSVAVDKYALASLVDGNTSSAAVTLSSGDTFVVTCELNNRYNVDLINYYCSGGSVSMYYAVSSGVWVEVPVSSDGNRFYANVSGVFPMAVKVVHSVSSSVEVYELELKSGGDDDIVFGNDITSQSVSTDVGSVTFLKLKNNSSAQRTFNVFVEDDSVGISTTATGVFTYRHSNVVAVPDSFPWDNGVHDGTMASGTLLVVSGTNSTGTYYSPVFDISSVSDGRVFFDGDDGGVSFGISFLSTASAPTIGVRLGFTPPTGTWHDGDSAVNDVLWGVPSGSLPFVAYANDQLVELREYNYAQLCITLSGGVGAYVSSVGLESPFIYSNIPAGGDVSVYISTVSGVAGSSSGLYVWWA